MTTTTEHGGYLRTRITDLFGIPVPIVLPGMTEISVPRLVAAVGEAGGLGLLASASLTPSELAGAIEQTQSISDTPFGIGVPLLVPGAREKIEIAVEKRVPVVNFALGKGDWIVELVHDYGGHVIATVTTLRHARAAAAAGADALLVTGHEAAGHGSTATSLVLIPSLAAELDVPIIAAGGFANGQGLVAALSLGADAIAMGTRFSVVSESPMHPDSKQAVLERTVEQTSYTDQFDGMDCRIMATPASEQLLQSRPGYLSAFRSAHAMGGTAGRSLTALYMSVLRSGPARMVRLARMAGASQAMYKALIEGDHQSGIQPVGQTQGLIGERISAGEVIDRTMREAHQTIAGLKQRFVP